MNKLIMGLSCLGVLSAVSCDNNEHTEKTSPPLEKVNFSAVTGTGDDFKLDTGDKITLIVKKGKGENVGNFAKYYTDSDRLNGTLFTNAGYEITLNQDGSVTDGFYLEAGFKSSPVSYTITKFDITNKSEEKVTYILSDPKGFSFDLTEGSKEPIIVSVVEKKEGSITGTEGQLGTKVSWGISKKDFQQLTFNLHLRKSDDSYFDSTIDNDDVINLDVKDGSNSVSPFPINNLFKLTGLTANSNQFTIQLPNEKDYYSNPTISGKAKNGGRYHSFLVESGAIKEGTVVLKIENDHKPLILNNGANGNGTPAYKKGSPTATGTNDVFDVTNNNSITVFKGHDVDNDKFTLKCNWALYKKGTDDPIIAGDSGTSKSGIGSIDGTINPSTIKDGTSNDAKLLSDDNYSKSDVESYYIKVHVTIDDGLGGSGLLKSVIFHLTK